MQAGRSNRKWTGQLFLGLGYLCVALLLVNICVRMGWIHLRLPGLTGFTARWRLALGAAVCFACAWYIARSGGVER